MLEVMKTSGFYLNHRYGFQAPTDMGEDEIEISTSRSEENL